jgi:hypothetical protein
MKRLLAVASVAILSTGCATMAMPEMQMAEEPLTEYQKIVDIPNTSQKKIYDGSKQWFAKNFHDSNSVIKYDNAEKGSIIGKGSMAMPCQGGALACYNVKDQSLRFTVKVDSKDNRARVSFEDLSIYTPASYSAGIAIPSRNSTPRLEKDVTVVKEMLESTVSSLAKDVKETASSEDW